DPPEAHGWLDLRRDRLAARHPARHRHEPAVHGADAASGIDQGSTAMTGQSTECDQVLMAIMATLDGEQPPLSQESISAHVERCALCAAAAAELRAAHARLAAVRYDGP